MGPGIVDAFATLSDRVGSNSHVSIVVQRLHRLCSRRAGVTIIELKCYQQRLLLLPPTFA
jgi:hypothetical protein